MRKNERTPNSAASVANYGSIQVVSASQPSQPSPPPPPPQTASDRRGRNEATPLNCNHVRAAPISGKLDAASAATAATANGHANSGQANGRVNAEQGKSERGNQTDAARGGPGDAGKAEPESLLVRAARRVPGLGIMLALCASLFLGSAGMLVKLTESVHGIQIAVLRSCVQLVIYGSVIGLRRIKPLPASPRELLAVLGRAVCGAISITLSYCCLRLISLGDATTIRFSLPIWTLIISYFVLGERCSLIKICAVLVSVSGVALLAKPDDCLYVGHYLFYNLNIESEAAYLQHLAEYERVQLRGRTNASSAAAAAAEPMSALISLANNTSSSPLSPNNNNDDDDDDDEDAAAATLDTNEIVEPLRSVPQAHLLSAPNADAANDDEEEQTNRLRHFQGCLMALGSSVCLSLSLVALRFCKQTPVEVTILWLSLSCILFGTITLLAMDEWRLPDNVRDLCYILLNGLCGSLGQWFITSALKIEQSSVIALARTFDIEVAFLYSALLLHERIRTTSIVGAVLVSSGVISVVLSKLLAGGRRDAPTSKSPNGALPEPRAECRIDASAGCRPATSPPPPPSPPLGRADKSAARPLRRHSAEPNADHSGKRRR